MQLFLCNSVRGMIPERMKLGIAAKITENSCDFTGELPSVTHVFFFEDAPKNPIIGKTVFLSGCVQNIRSAGLKKTLGERIRQTIHKYASVSMDQIVVTISEIPENCVMEGGVLHANSPIRNEPDATHTSLNRL